MKKATFALSLIFFFVVGFLLLCARGIIIMPKDYSSHKEIVFSVREGEGVREIAAHLQGEGLIKSPVFFVLYAVVSTKAKMLQAGDYEVSASMDVPQLVAKFASGDVIRKKFTIIEGWNTKDIAQSLDREGLFQQSDFQEAIVANWSSEFDFLKDKPATASIEGYLFPDTYEFKYSEKVKDAVRKFLSNFAAKMSPSFRLEIANQHKSIFQIVTMASLLEKEVKTPQDKQLVAGILWKRLKFGMPLQVDATIAYVTGSNEPQSLARGKSIDSPYNTYKYRGLPIGPIDNPGKESIAAAIFPQASDYWYYFSAPDGTTIFSKTFQEHVAAVAKYLR